VKASFVLTSIVTTLRRLNRPLVSTVNVRDWPDGIGPPAPVNTLLTPGRVGSADSSTALFASSAMAATPWLAISPTLQTSALPEWTTKSGGDSGCEPGAPGPGGVRFETVTCHVFAALPPSSSSSSSAVAEPVRSAAAASPASRTSRMRLIPFSFPGG
jgi:hypothetical protein